MVSLESISAEIEAISCKKENLRKSFEQLQPHSSALSFSLQWQDIERYFDSIENSILDSFRHLQSKAHNHHHHHHHHHNPQSQIDQSSPTLESKEPLGKLGLFKFQPETNPEKSAPDGPARPEPGSDGLRCIVRRCRSSPSTVYDKVAGKLRSSANPAKMAFDVVESLDFDFYEGECFVLEALMKIAPEVEITVAEAERKRALKLAGRWMRVMGEIDYDCALPEAFLKLVRAFELISDVGVDGLFEAFSRFENEERIAVFREFGLEEKAPEFIQKLIGENKHMFALEFVLAFKLGDKFPPPTLLEDYLKEAKRQADEIRRSGNGNLHEAYSATKTEISAMNLVIKSIKENNIKAGSLLESVVESKSKLEEQAHNEHIAARAVSNPQEQLGNKRPQPAAKDSGGPQNRKKSKRQP